MLETVKSFHNDLKRFSKTDIDLMAKHEDLQSASTDDLRWLLAIRHAMKKGEMPLERLLPALCETARNSSFKDFVNYANSSNTKRREIRPHLPYLINECITDITYNDLVNVIIKKNTYLFGGPERKDIIVNMFMKLEPQTPPNIIKLLGLVMNDNFLNDIVGNENTISNRFDAFNQLLNDTSNTNVARYLLTNKVLPTLPQDIKNSLRNSLSAYIILLFYGYMSVDINSLKDDIKYVIDKYDGWLHPPSLRTIAFTVCHLSRQNLLSDRAKDELNRFIESRGSGRRGYYFTEFIEDIKDIINKGAVNCGKFDFKYFDRFALNKHLIPDRFQTQFVENDWAKDILTYEDLITEERYRPGGAGALEAQRHFEDAAEEMHYRPGNEGALDAAIDFESRAVEQEFGKP